jgi:hypothetical protein
MAITIFKLLLDTLGINTVDLNGTKPSPEGEGWVRGN